MLLHNIQEYDNNFRVADFISWIYASLQFHFVPIQQHASSPDKSGQAIRQ